MQQAQEQLLRAQSNAARVAKARARMEVETLRISQRIEIVSGVHVPCCTCQLIDTRAQVTDPPDRHPATRCSQLNNMCTQATLLAGSAINMLGGEALETLDASTSSWMQQLVQQMYVGAGALALVQ